MDEAGNGRSVGFDRIAHRYDETRGGDERGDRMAEQLAALLDPAAPALEIGVGTGVVAAGLVKRGFSVAGLDLSPAMAARARRRLGDRVVVADAEHIPIRDAAVCQAFAVWVLHLLADPVRHVEEVRRILQPGGRYVVVPSGRPNDPLGRIQLELARTLRPSWRVVQDPDGIAEIAARAGLRPGRVVEFPPAEFEESPAAMAADFEARTYSFLWDLDETDWNAHVAPAIAALRAMPDPDRPIRCVRIDRAISLERSR